MPISLIASAESCAGLIGSMFLFEQTAAVTPGLLYALRGLKILSTSPASRPGFFFERKRTASRPFGAKATA